MLQWKDRWFLQNILNERYRGTWFYWRKIESSIIIYNKSRFSYVTNIEQKKWFCERKTILRFEIDFATIDTRMKSRLGRKSWQKRGFQTIIHLNTNKWTLAFTTKNLYDTLTSFQNFLFTPFLLLMNKAPATTLNHK